MIFNDQGNLILPKGAREFHRKERKKFSNRQRTGIMVSCWKCGHSWERTSRRSVTVRCRNCGQSNYLEAVG